MKLTNVDGRLVVSDYQPPRPELPILPEHPIFDDHDFTITETKSGYIIQGKAGNSALVGNDGNIYDTNTGEVIGTAKKGNSEVVLMNGHGQHVATWSTTDGLTLVERDETIDQGVRPPIENFKSELSDKVRSLSQEQRQQIKQAIKDRAARS